MQHPIPAENQPSLHQLQAENDRLREELSDYRERIGQQTETIRELSGQASAGTVIRSYYDLQNDELIRLREYIRELMQRAEGAAGRESELKKQVSLAVSSSRELDDIRSQYNYLQAQLSDLQDRLQELHRQQVAIQQQAARVAELESQLAIAEEEIELLKLRQAPPEQDLPHTRGENE